MVENTERLLDHINDPSELRKLKVDKLPEVCKELRDYIIDALSNNPGHFGASLGVVELTVALHYVFNTPYDLLIWDVGHQAYGHKILTGRKNSFHSNRKYKGISGFPKPSESEYDAFGVGHSSTSISAALGMAVARDLKQEDNHVVAVIGDGSLTCGMALEAMNHAGHLGGRLIVILNDNEMSIAHNVGAISRALNEVRVDPRYHKAKEEVDHVLHRLPGGGSATHAGRKVLHGLKVHYT
jgi:1-deoxy-D-xylulose-5-phosphate synthase